MNKTAYDRQRYGAIQYPPTLMDRVNNIKRTRTGYNTMVGGSSGAAIGALYGLSRKGILGAIGGGIKGAVVGGGAGAATSMFGKR